MAKLVGGGDDTSGDTVDNRRGKTFQRRSIELWKW